MAIKSSALSAVINAAKNLAKGTANPTSAASGGYSTPNVSKTSTRQSAAPTLSNAPADPGAAQAPSVSKSAATPASSSGALYSWTGSGWAANTPGTAAAANVNNYFPSADGKGSVPSYYAERSDFSKGTTTAPDGDTLNLHDWSKDTTDYAALALNAKTNAELQQYLQDRVNKANAQGIDISGNGSAVSNEAIYGEWYNNYGENLKDSYIINGVQGQGYYGMDGNGNWGYYDDPALTRKSANGGWDTYRSSDGGPATFSTANGYLWPTSGRDVSRAGQKVIVASGNKAFEMEYDELGYVRSTRPVNVDVSMLRTAQYDPSRDAGVSSREILQNNNGVGYVGPGGSIDQNDVKAGTSANWDAIMAGRGYTGVTPQADLTQREEPIEQYDYSGYSEYSGGSGGTGGDSGNSGGGDLVSLYKGLYEENGPYDEVLREQQAANDASVQRTVNRLEQQKTETDNSYSDLFRQLYIDRMRNQKNIGQQMAASGITGGAAESTLLGLGAQYEDALRQGEQSRLGAIGDIDLAIENARLTGDIATAEAAASATQARINNYANVIKALISRQDALDARRETYAREDALRQAAYAREDALRQAEYEQRQAAYDEESAATSRSYAYKTAMQLINTGYMPGEELLDAAGIDAASAQALVASVQAERAAEAEKAAAAAAKPLLTAAQVNAAIKAGNLTPNVLSAYQYYYGRPYRR